MVDGFFIRSLLLAFFFKLFPEIIQDGRLYVAEPPLYRVDDKKNPFVINKVDYIERYVKAASKDYSLGYQTGDDNLHIDFLSKSDWKSFLDDTAGYIDDMRMLVDHYKVNDRLLEIILEEFVYKHPDIDASNVAKLVDSVNIQSLMNRIGTEFRELYYDDKDQLIKGAIDGKYQILEISEQLMRKAIPLLDTMKKWLPPENGFLILKNLRTSSESKMSLMEVLKILKKYQPNILHRFKGLRTLGLVNLIAGNS